MKKGSTVRYVDIIEQAGAALLSCEVPARYAGGEFGKLARRDAPLQTVMAFPDLYEIGMCNNAVKILYNRLNEISGISCDRVFMPAPDFEKLLRERDIPLYALDTGLPVRDAALFMFTISYELCATNILAMLDAARIPLHANERGARDPIVMAGGPCVSNPLPYAPFIDVFWIGEAEDDFFQLVETARDMSAAGAGREQILSSMAEHPAVWLEGKARAVRAFDFDFARHGPHTALFPLPSARVAHEHASLEIMRGCPNGCRFCHAGVWYRPWRQKPLDVILDEASAYVRRAGYRELSLSSLSSGDYEDIGRLVPALMRQFEGERVSLQLPSLHISTLSLRLLEDIAQVRKSALTFAVETPNDARQLAINKKITLEQITDILKTAKKTGYKTAKFYFMLGLPVYWGQEAAEEDELIGFIREAARQSGMRFHISVGVFIPKPHTPFQWAAQLDEETARRKLIRIKQELCRAGHQVKFHDPFMSTLEGLLSRGGQRAALVIEEAYRAGCRLDAWSEYFQEDIWRGILERHAGLVKETLSCREPAAALPWSMIASGVTETHLREEWERSKLKQESAPCANRCSACERRCGIGSGRKRSSAAPPVNEPGTTARVDRAGEAVPPVFRPSAVLSGKHGLPAFALLCSCRKEGKAVFTAHLMFVEILRQALIRSRFPLAWTEGFNPLPRIEVASPLALGISSGGEFVLIGTDRPVAAESALHAINNELPEGIVMIQARFITIPFGVKKHSLASLLWGFEYERENNIERVSKTDDKAYRAEHFPGGNYGIRRREVLAINEAEAPASYFDVYRKLYPSA